MLSSMFESIIASLMTGGLTLLGVIYTVRKQHDVTVEELKFEIRTIKKDIKELETKQDKHNQVVERVYELEKVAEVLEERQKTANHRIDDLERKDD